jgi:hypothetical protein
MAGTILIVAALVPGGKANCIDPEAVIEGFTIGIALIIAVSQLKDLFGLSIAKTTRRLSRCCARPVGCAAFGEHDGCADRHCLDCRDCASAQAGWPDHRHCTRICRSGASSRFPVETNHSRFGSLPSGLPFPSLPPISLARMSELLPSALVIAFWQGLNRSCPPLSQTGWWAARTDPMRSCLRKARQTLLRLCLEVSLRPGPSLGPRPMCGPVVGRRSRAWFTRSRY